MRAAILGLYEPNGPGASEHAAELMLIIRLWLLSSDLSQVSCSGWYRSLRFSVHSGTHRPGRRISGPNARDISSMPSTFTATQFFAFEML